MRKVEAIIAERPLQLPFSFIELFQLLVFTALFVGSWQFLGRRFNLAQLPPRATTIRFDPVPLSGWNADLRLAGSWVLTSNDPRFGGFSGLAVDGGRLLALTDQGSVAWLPKPGAADRAMIIRQLPNGPSSGRFGWNRDTEALARDPLGRGWWVTFEKANELWLYEPDFSAARKQIRLGPTRWPNNLGIEGLVAREGPEILMFVEAEDRLFAMRGGRAVAAAIAGRALKLSEAALLPDGRILAIERDLRFGFTNQLVRLEQSGAGWRIEGRIRLPVGTLDNIEGVAAESLPDGGTRLWMISDDNFQRPLRTLLIAVDLPPRRQRR